MRGGLFCTGAIAWLIALAVLVPARAAPSPDRSCTASGAKTYRFDQGLGPGWTISTRPMKTPAAPYPDGSIDGDIADNVQSFGGVLHLLSRRAGIGFTGSRVLSRELVRYGCVEIVARLPRGRGFWPALWLRTPYDGTPINGEIDLVEGFGSHPGVIMSSLHHWRNGIDAKGGPHDCARIVADVPRSAAATQFALARAKWEGEDRGDLGNWLFANFQNRCLIYTVAKTTDFSVQFHRYTLIWAPDRVIWTLDGRPCFEAHTGIPQAAMMIVMGLSVGSLDGGATAGTPGSGDLQVRSVRVMPLSDRIPQGG